MNSNPTRLATMLMVVVALASIGTTATAFAKETPPGIAEHADENVHNIAGTGSQQDVRFHEGLCQAGISTEALGPQGCDNQLLSDPGASDNRRQDN